MSLDTKITRNLKGNYVQVDVVSNKAPTRYFKVPQPKADEFCKKYKKRDSRDSWVSNGTFIGSVIAGCYLMSKLTSKLSSSARIALNIISGVGIAIGSTILTNKIMAPKHEEFVKSFGAEEIYFDNIKFPTSK